MPEIRKLSRTDLKEIYQTYIKKDFPLMEQRPWPAVERAWERGRYAAYGYCEGERLLAYAAFYSASGFPQILMDYFAVVPQLRRRGIGSAFLAGLVTGTAPAGGIFIEAEHPDRGGSEEEESVRRGRIEFYRANGAVTTGVGCRLFGVDYQILCIPGQDGAEEDYYETLCRLYREIYHPVYGKLCRPYVEDGEETSGAAGE